MPFIESIPLQPSPIPLEDWTFHHTCADLAQRVDLARHGVVDRYLLLGCAGLLRKLLLDERPLVTAANRNRRLALEFQAHEFGTPILLGNPDEIAYGVWIQGPAMLRGNATTPLLRYTRVDAWVGHVTGRVGDDPITIRQLVKFGAHVEGGVHLGRPGTLAEERLASLIPAYLRPGVSPRELFGTPLGSLVFIADATLDGLAPLREAVLLDWPELA